jgi:geranylgeranyl pyrophosphate synthase
MAAIPRAVAIELIQAATLIHDDFVDQDTVRRNRPALWTQEGARRAVLIGDVIFASAISMMSELGRSDGLVVSRAIVQIAKGALHEPLDPPALVVKLESGGLPGEWYEHIIRLKTGILFGSACKLGAIAAEADEKVGEACYRFGLRLGEAYQIADDVKDVKEITSAGGMSVRQLVTLTPSLLHFAPERRADIAARLREGCTDGDDNLLLDAAEAMGHEIGQRLDRAAREIEGTFPETAYGPLMRRVASDVVGMFNDA